MSDPKLWAAFFAGAVVWSLAAFCLMSLLQGETARRWKRDARESPRPDGCEAESCQNVSKRWVRDMWLCHKHADALVGNDAMPKECHEPE